MKDAGVRGSGERSIQNNEVIDGNYSKTEGRDSEKENMNFLKAIAYFKNSRNLLGA